MNEKSDMTQHEIDQISNELFTIQGGQLNEDEELNFWKNKFSEMNCLLEGRPTGTNSKIQKLEALYQELESLQQTWKERNPIMFAILTASLQQILDKIKDEKEELELHSNSVEIQL